MRRLNTKSVMAALDIKSRETLAGLVRRGLLPPPMKDSDGGPNYWIDTDVDGLIEAQAEARARKQQEQRNAPRPAAA